ncbi:MAG TPA: SAM-dependent methyltransferase [Mycobacteriales bacterium]|jgi:SAM-dependent MidA family methyltransferase|nr:SAM-dependent methyltransferase [Mycobacteriales bacterium]
MAESLYGDPGFYKTSGAPAHHFRTAAHTGQTWTTAIARLATEVDVALGEPADFTVVDIGAGGGELLAGLADIVPGRWSLLGVDVAERPAGLSRRVDWQRGFPDQVHGLVLAVELLDVVPVNVVELTDQGPCVIEVDEDGFERIGGPVDPPDHQWLSQWWPIGSAGERAEIGSRRDEMWHDITSRVATGLAVAVDYAADPSRVLDGTLAGYRDGHRRLPAPDSTMDLTAHVLFESLLVEGDVLLSQREALRRLGVAATPPEYRGDGDTYLAELTKASEAAELLNPYGLGGFTWLWHSVGMKLPLLG